LNQVSFRCTYVSCGVGAGAAIAVYGLTLLFLGLNQRHFAKYYLALILLMPYIELFPNQFRPICFFKYDATISQNIKLEKNDQQLKAPSHLLKMN
jgi:hypothetical protein